MSILSYVIVYWKHFACSVLLLAICLSNKLVFLPITGLYLLAYLLSVGAVTTWIAFVTVQNFLQQNKPLDLPKLLNLKTEMNPEDFDFRKSVQQLTLDIDKLFIAKWFIYISQDTTFNAESKIVLQEMLQKLVNVQLNLDKEVIIHGCLNLYLKHLKEFRRSLKRREKYEGKISDLFQYSHVTSTSKKTRDYFIHQISHSLLNHFINWELGNSLPYQVLVGIVSRKVIRYLLNLLSNPEFLNLYILSLCASPSVQAELQLHNYGRIKITQVTENGSLTPNDLSKSTSKTNLLPDSSATKSELEAAKPIKPEYVEFKAEDVKIYEPRSVKTWYDSLDLSTVPLGQDILDSINVDDSDKDVDEKEEILSPISSAKNLLDEVKQITSLEGLKTSMKPISNATANTLHNIKDFQETTVNNVSQATTTALHKIGGLHLQDEAAGVVEGILDFGRTRIRKGLRLTGLQDGTSTDQLKPMKKIVPKTPVLKPQEKVEDLETSWINPLHEEPQGKTTPAVKIPSIQTQDDGSPEPEYEETADLATSIAKLRSLLAQKSSESGVSTPAFSPMPSEDISNKNDADEIDETDRMVPSFYKFCAKTATGVIHNTLNTIKTALPGNVAEADKCDGSDKWLFVEANSSDSDMLERMRKLLYERKVFCTVDTAYEAIDSLGTLQQDDKLKTNIPFEDELDDFEVKLPVIKALCDILCELLAEVRNSSLTQEPVIKSFLLLFGSWLEELVVTKANYYMRNACANAAIPSETKIETLSLDLEQFTSALLSSVPDYVISLIGEEAFKAAVKLFITSLQIQRINQDLLIQILEVIALKLMEGSKQMTPISA